MDFVKSDENGELFPVQPTHAVAISANASQATDGPRLSKVQAAFIQAAMSQAVAYCYQLGRTDAKFVRESMMTAREAAKKMIAEGNGPAEEGEGNLAG